MIDCRKEIAMVSMPGLSAMLVALAGCSSMPDVALRDIQPVAITGDETLVELDHFSVKGIRHFRALIEPDFTKDSFTDVVIAPLQFNLPDEKDEKMQDDDRQKLREAYDRAKEKVFEDFALANKAGPDTLVIYTWLTDEVPSNVVMNYALWIIVPAMNVGAAAVETQVFTGDRLVATAVGARNGTIAVSGYTKWGVIEQGFEMWLTGVRRWIEKVQQGADYSAG